ncbi:hypothetical protein, partial [Streptomyces sp. NPDC001389]|uniref:hypothetical protein n=1 Tax=Streptomyces sp. NPDC001389 TaxID=3364569 RepID=UPI0036C2A339
MFILILGRCQAPGARQGVAQRLAWNSGAVEGHVTEIARELGVDPEWSDPRNSDTWTLDVSSSRGSDPRWQSGRTTPKSSSGTR